jgi:hypothetical protein
MCPDGAPDVERLCWRRPAAKYCSLKRNSSRELRGGGQSLAFFLSRRYSGNYCVLRDSFEYFTFVEGRLQEVVSCSEK